MREIQPLFADAAKTLRERFVIPPFSVLDSRQSYWLRRKRKWIALGIQSELGRDAACFNNKEFLGSIDPHLQNLSNTSIFDPVLCEIAYRWFCPTGGTVIDPFAGGSVRGIVAGTLGYPYFGMELRTEQVEANKAQLSCLGDGCVVPTWIQGDSRLFPRAVPKGFQADLLFTCPPYYNVEVYSDHPKDISNAPTYGEFIESLWSIFNRSVALLREDRFIVVVVGDIRSKDGYYCGLVADTIRIIEDCGAKLYNEAVFLSPVGSAMLRADRQFSTNRKLVKGHQNVLVFFKGNVSNIRTIYGEK